MSTVLVVHADAAIAAARAAAITRAGHEARAATSGERAMDRFIQEPVDVVVIDLQLEGRDGRSTAEAIRWMPGGRRARVVLTAASEPEGASLAELGRGLDAFATLRAPDPEALARVVSQAAAVRAHEAETRVLEVEQALFRAERARSAAWEEATPSGPDGVFSLDDSTEDEPARVEWEWRDTDGRAEGREVRAIAEDAERTESSLAGSFEAMPFARLLHRLAERRATGALVCVHPPDERATTEGTEPTKIVYFRAGVPVHVRSNLVDECLGQVLARARRIGPATLRESLSAVERGEGRQGEVLVEMGAIAPLELSEALAEQLRLKLFELFAWQRGTFRFAIDRAPPRELIDLGLGLAEIAFLGVREGMKPERVLARLAPDRERFVVPRPRELVRFVRLHVPEPLRALIRDIDGTRRLRELLERSGDRIGAAQLVYAMECLSAVRFEDAPLRALAPPPDESAERGNERETRVVRADELASSLESMLGEAGAELARPTPLPLREREAPRLPPTRPERSLPKSEGTELPSDVPPAHADASARREAIEGAASAPDASDGGRVAARREHTAHASERGDASEHPATSARSSAPRSHAIEGAAPRTDASELAAPTSARANDAIENPASSARAYASDLRAATSARASYASEDAASSARAHASELDAATTARSSHASELAAPNARAGANARADASEGANARADASELAAATSAPRARSSDASEGAANTRADASEHAASTSGRSSAPSSHASEDPESNTRAHASELAAATSAPRARSSEASEGANARADASEHAASTSARSSHASEDAASSPRADASEHAASALASPSARRPGVDEAPPESDPKVLNERVERLLAAERHFRRGQRALDREKYEEALAAFSRAVALCPDEGQFLAYLAWATHAAAPDDAFALSEALDLAERGARFAPELAVAHLLHGRLLRAAGRSDAARGAFARVLELDPTSDEAARALG